MTLKSVMKENSDSNSSNLLYTSEIDTSQSYKRKIKIETDNKKLVNKKSIENENKPNKILRFEKEEDLSNYKADAVQSVKQFFTENSIKYILKQINKKIKRYKNNTEEFNKFLGEEEFFLFIGIILSFGMCNPKNVKDIWNKNKICFNSFISEKMSYKRFAFINSKFTFFSKKDKKDGFIIKKPKFILYLIKLFQNNFAPKENLSLDESTCDFKGRILNLVFNKNKPSKYGIKLYTLCDSKTSYLLNLQICGEKIKLNEMILSLTNKYSGKYHILHMDNFYNSVQLSETLLANKIHTNGTIRKNRGIPEDLINKTAEKFTFIVTRINNIYFYNYNDNKEVHMISTVFDGNYVEKEGKAWKKDKNTGRKISTIVQKKIPEVIISYNKNMNGVDKLNQSIKSLNIKRSTKKWDKKLSLFILAAMLNNSYILWKPEEGIKKSRKAFDENLIKHFLNFNGHKNEKNHFCDKGGKSGRCVFCYKIDKKRAETNHYCVSCDKFIHPGTCFKKYHENN
jgi:transposase IS4-like protein